MLCIRRTLAEGRLTGFLSGLGAASADMLYGAVAAFGLTAVQNLLVGQQVWLRLMEACSCSTWESRRFFQNRLSRLLPSKGLATAVRICPHLPNLDQPGDNPGLCGHLCRVASWRKQRRLCQRHLDRAGSVPGLGRLVVDF